MHITHEMNRHNCQLCHYECLGRCFNVYSYGKDISWKNKICKNYIYGGSDKRLKEINDTLYKNAKDDKVMDKWIPIKGPS